MVDGERRRSHLVRGRRFILKSRGRPVSATPRGSPAGVRAGDVRAFLGRRVGKAVDALQRLAGGLGTAVLALAAVTACLMAALLSLVGVGVPLLSVAARGLRAAADRERERLSRDGIPMPAPGVPPTGVRAVLTDAVVRRELLWAGLHATLGLLTGLAGVTLALDIVRDATFPLWWRIGPETESSASLGWPVSTWPGALGVMLLGFAWIPMTVVLAPVFATIQTWPGTRLLAPSRDLALRVVELSATRAAALDAHAAELRRIERALHDGTQNRLITVTVMLGALERAVQRGDPATATLAVERARAAAEGALEELRAVIGGILPPILEQHSLVEALTSVAAACPVPCTVDIEPFSRLPASVEATAWFVVAEALTNVARHSGAGSASLHAARVADRLHLGVHDDGVGGAELGHGTGLVGSRRRIEAHDGEFVLHSPPGGPTTLEVTIPCAS